MSMVDPVAPPAISPESLYKLFFRPGEVVEIRVLGCSGRAPIQIRNDDGSNVPLWDGFAAPGVGAFGYFDDPSAISKYVVSLNSLPPGKAPDGIYFTPNPPIPSLIARAANRLVAAGKKRAATHNHEILSVRWLLIDLDIGKSLRPSGISSTDEELRIAAAAARDLLAWTTQQGFPDPIKAFSGNGYHLVWRTETLPPDEATSGKGGLIHSCLSALSAQMRKIEARIEVDLSVHNAARIWKFYGTVARKGDHTPQRPHRLSRIMWSPADQFDELPKVSKPLLEKLAAMAPKENNKVATRPPQVSGSGTRRLDNDAGPLDVRLYADHYGVEIRDEQVKNGSTWYRLNACVFDPSHMFPDSAIVQNDDGTVWYHCSHDSCNYKWGDARREISGSDKIYMFCKNYDPNKEDPDKGKKWKSSKPAGKGILRDIEIVAVDDKKIRVRPDGLPCPEKIHPQEFFDFKGKRERFVVLYAARYLAAWWAPLVWTEGVFYHYKDGCWRDLDPMILKQTLIIALKERVQANWLVEALTILSGLIHRKEEDWPQYPSLINVENGMVDMDMIIQAKLDTALVDHDPKYGSRIQLPVKYNQDALFNEWMKYLDGIFPETIKNNGKDSGIISRHKHSLMQQFCGYVLLPHCKYEKCLFCYGGGANGKSTFLNVFEAVIGPDNVVSISIDGLARSFNIPYLRGKLLSIAGEIETREPAGTETFKKCISGDLISGEKKYGEYIKFRNIAKFIFAMNNPPNIVDRSWGFKRKVLVVYFNRRFEEHEMDRDLAEKLIAEKEGIFLWALIGAGILVSQGSFMVPAEVDEEQQNFMATVNPLLMFIDECCILDEDDQIRASILYQAYCDWIEAGHQKALGRNNFYSALLNNYPKVKRTRLDLDGGSPVGFKGIRLRAVY
jgi:P4 family phage/plasmid primase-like protien